MWNSDLYVLDAVFQMVGALFSREGRRNLARGAFVLLSFALTMVGLVYLVYGRGPQCVVKVGKPVPHLRQHWYWPFEDRQLWLRTPAEIEKEVPNCR